VRSIATWPRRTLHWVRDHFLTGFIALLTAGLSTIVLLAASGLLLSPTAPAAQAPPTTSTTTTVPSGSVTLDTSPATVVVASVMNQLRNVTGFTSTNPSFATTDPLLAGCASSIIPVAQIARSLTLSSASLEVVVDVNVYGAGLGGRVLARTLRSTSACAGDYVQSTSLTGLEGFMASSTDVSGSSILEVTARVGDVVFSLYGFPTAYQSASSATLALATVVLDALTPAMATICATEHEGPIAAQRNPTQSDYRPYAVTTVVTPPTSVPRPNLSLLDGVLAVLPTPAPGSITTAPTPPAVPTVALSTTVARPQVDQTGPGCGWAFTAMVPPVFSSPPEQLSVQSADAIAQLERTWTNWPTTVNAYLAAKAVYLSELASYEATTTTTTTTTTPPNPTTTTTIAGAPSTTTTILGRTPGAVS
jgi:hypothetical protein